VSLDLMHRNAYAVLIKEATRLNMFGDSKFCKDILRIITVIAYVTLPSSPSSTSFSLPMFAEYPGGVAFPQQA
jgi:hypothetical protein